MTKIHRGRAGTHGAAPVAVGSRATSRAAHRTRSVAVTLIVAVVVVAPTGVTTRAEAAEPPTVTASLVRMIDTSAWNPASPDPSGVAYVPSTDRIVVVDSEVDETTGAGYHDVNLWQVDRSTGDVVDVGTAWTPVGFSKEPTGLGFIASTHTLLITDDNQRVVWMVRAGADGRFGTTDDTRTSIDTSAFGSTDTEDPEYLDGHIYVLDGMGRRIYDVLPGGDGTFGTRDDRVSHVDIGHLGPIDFEALSADPVTGHLLVGARAERRIYEITTSGSLVREIDCSAIPRLDLISGLAYAPSSTGTGWSYWIADRQVDNGRDPKENDGKLWEVAVPTAAGPPSVSLTAPAQGAAVRGDVAITAAAAGDRGIASVSFFDGTMRVGTDTDGDDGWAVSWKTTGGADGTRSVTAVATDTDGASSTSSSVTVHVDNTAPSRVVVRRPKPGAVVSGPVTVRARARDAIGVARVRFFDGTTRLATDRNGDDGWSVRWRSGRSAEGVHRLRAVAWDVAGNRAASTRVKVIVRHDR